MHRFASFFLEFARTKKKPPHPFPGAGAEFGEVVPQLGSPHPGLIRTSPRIGRIDTGTTTLPSRAGGVSGAADTFRRSIVKRTLRYLCDASSNMVQM